MNSVHFPRVSFVVVALALLGVAGCSTVNLDPKGQTQATFVAGEFRALVNATAPVATKATTEAFRQLGLFQIKNELRTFDAELAARTPKDEKVRITIKEINSRQTEIAIRVDVVGNRNFSRQLFDQIDKNLGSGARSSGGF
ncbi:MAG: hypothetical protein RL376_200 [Verrucomicrobiota bacterium]|jgi:hypothetical protein